MGYVPFARRKLPGKPDGTRIISSVVLTAELMLHPISASCTLYVICRATALVLECIPVGPGNLTSCDSSRVR